jgi:hypothetical protein
MNPQNVQWICHHACISPFNHVPFRAGMVHGSTIPSMQRFFIPMQAIHHISPYSHVSVFAYFMTWFMHILGSSTSSYTMHMYDVVMVHVLSWLHGLLPAPQRICWPACHKHCPAGSCCEVHGNM